MLPPGHYQTIKEAKFTYSSLRKEYKKQTKITEKYKIKNFKAFRFLHLLKRIAINKKIYL